MDRKVETNNLEKTLKERRPILWEMAKQWVEIIELEEYSEQSRLGKIVWNLMEIIFLAGCVMVIFSLTYYYKVLGAIFIAFVWNVQLWSYRFLKWKKHNKK